MKRSFLIVLIPGLALAGLSAIASTQGGGDPTYLTTKVERGDIVTTITATGTVTPVVTVKVGSQLSGQIADLLVDFNDAVREGQQIARLDPQAFAATVRESKASLAVAGANLAAKQAALERARASLANARATLGVVKARTASARARYDHMDRALQRLRAIRGGAITVSVLDQAQADRDAASAELRAARAQERVHATTILMAESEFRIAEAEVENARASIAEKEAALSHAEVELERTVIKAPIDGVVIGRDIDRGQTVAASLEAPTLFTIAEDIGNMKVETGVDEADIGRVRLGQRANFLVDSYPARSFVGAVVQIRKAPYLHRNVVTYTVIVSAKNPDHALLPGMTANVEIMVDEATNVLKVPNAALRFASDFVSCTPIRGLSRWRCRWPGDRVEPISGVEAAEGQSGLVWVLDADGHPAPIPIRIGVSDSIVTEVTSGPLAEGQEVITLGVPQTTDSGILLLPWKS